MFDWDESKRKRVLKTHSVDFAKIADVFDDPFALFFDDHEHSGEREVRSGVIGKTAEYGLIVLIYSEFADNRFRFITARRAEKWMVNDYERQKKRP